MNSVEFTSEAVRSAKFREKLKGYHPEDVDAFLERAAAALDQLSARLAETTARALKAEGALAGNSEADETVRKTLVLAQRTADLAVNEAKEEARQIREEAEAEAARVRESASAEADGMRAAAETDAAALRAEAGRVHAAAVEHATATVDEADAAAQAQLREATERVAAAEAEARAERERLHAEALRESEEMVRSLTLQQQQLRADVGALARYLAGERARVLEVLTTAVGRFGETLAPARPNDVGEIDRSLDREELAKGTPDPAAEDSWNFDPTVLEQPENQWWSSPEEGAPEGAALWAAHLGSDEPLPEWFTSAVADAGQHRATATTSAVRADDGKRRPGEADAEAEPTTDDPGPEANDGPVSESEHPTGQDPTPDDEPPSRLLFTLDDESRRAEIHDSEPVAEGKPRKTLLGRHRS